VSVGFFTWQHIGINLICFSGYANIFIYQVEVHDVGKEMELDLIKQYSQVDC
jgi:hypothetical protein